MGIIQMIGKSSLLCPLLAVQLERSFLQNASNFWKVMQFLEFHDILVMHGSNFKAALTFEAIVQLTKQVQVASEGSN